MANFLPGLRPSWIPFGWFIAASITALVLLALVSVGVVSDSPASDGVWVATALTIGFGLAGLYVGSRVAAAPTLHGLGMGLFSVAAWFLVNLLLGEPTDQTAWRQLPPAVVIGLLALQTAAAIVGARFGVRWNRRGRS